MGDPLNLSSILSEMMDVDYVVGCGFGDRNGLTLVLEGQISRYFFERKKIQVSILKKATTLPRVSALPREKVARGAIM